MSEFRSDLISRAALINDLSYCAPELFFDEDYLIAKVMKQPAVDAVEVVRCRNCKYAHMTYDGEVKYCDRISMPDDEGDYGYALYLPGDFYCACGERKDGGAADESK